MKISHQLESTDLILAARLIAQSTGLLYLESPALG